jgi:hypothetical protein
MSRRKVNCAAVGALSELAVSVDLMRQGFEVFRNMSPAGKTDLIAKKGLSSLFRIQVKTRVGVLEDIKGNDVLVTYNNGDITYRVATAKLIPVFERAQHIKKIRDPQMRRALQAWRAFERKQQHDRKQLAGAA